MTDKEIIKALECCSNASWSSCHDCPYRENQFKNHCAFTLSGDALDLINRQQAEIEEMHKRIVYLDEDREGWSRTATTKRLKNIELQAEIERLQKENNEMREDITQSVKLLKRLEVLYSNDIEIAKAEAIKEFAERLKEMASQTFWETDAYVGMEQIDNLVKEMVGEDE